MPEFEPVDRNKLFLTLDDHDPVPFYTGKTFGWDLVPGRRDAPILRYNEALPKPDPNVTTLRCYWKTRNGYVASPLTFGRIEVFTRDLSIYIDDPQMAVEGAEVKLKGQFESKLQLQLSITADGRLLMEEIEPAKDQQNP